MKLYTQAQIDSLELRCPCVSRSYEAGSISLDEAMDKADALTGSRGIFAPMEPTQASKGETWEARYSRAIFKTLK